MNNLRSDYDKYLTESERVLSLSREGRDEEGNKLILGEFFDYL
jgi:hypothetical protein